MESREYFRQTYLLKKILFHWIIAVIDEWEYKMTNGNEAQKKF